MQQAALGFRVHSGWTALVAISLEEGSPRLLLRQRPRLVGTFTFEFRQPYHTAANRPLGEAREILSRARSEARSLARKAICSVRDSLLAIDCKLKSCGILLSSGRPLPTLPRILASHALIHTADGELFRQAVMHAAKRSGLETYTAVEKEIAAQAAASFHLRENELLCRLGTLGRGLGPPWTQDEKLAALAAWLSLVNRGATLSSG